MNVCKFSVLVAAFALSASGAHAASLQVAPVSVEVSAPGAAATITLRNEGTTALNAQIRVFRWVQLNGEEKLEATADVIASPPITKLVPKTDYTVRLVRVSKQPLSTGESYRLFVDELPDPKARQNGVVTLVMRYSIPVFFEPAGYRNPQVSWSIRQQGGRAFVSATNSGDRRVRISRLRLQDAKGTTVSFGDGLTGYVLGHSTMQWVAPRNAQRLSARGVILISSVGDLGPISAKASIEDAN